MSCLQNRIKLLLYLERQAVIQDASYHNALHRVIGFYDYLMPDILRFKTASAKEKELEMKEYEKLAGWNSNEYLIFKGTCEKFQRKIHYILKRHDEELSMAVGTYHMQLQTAQIYSSMKDFNRGLSALVENKYVEETEEDEEEAKENG
jgi:hypothetical protein